MTLKRPVAIWSVLLIAAGGLTVEAADMLHGGGGVAVQASGGVTTGPVSTTAQAAALTQRAENALARATMAAQAMSSMQSAARAAAASVSGPNNLINPANAALNVPNGLSTAGAGGLVPDSGLSTTGVANQVTTWTNAQTPVQTNNADGTTTVTVTQTAQQALMNWLTFNIGKETKLKFDQSLGGADVNQWIAFNKINDPSGRPSQILGSIEAPGQAYVLNQNGILFGGSSQTNLHTLVASSLPINDNLVNLGLLNNADQQFLFSSLALAAGKNGTPAFTPPAPLTANGRPGDVVVQAGAILSSPTTAANVGGRNVLIGPNVVNNGTISNPDGQTILAAGQQVAFLAHSSSDPSLRGLDVYVGSVDSGSGSVTNAGLIDAPRASVILTGKDVFQLGVIASTTSVSLNGRIDLLANYNVAGNPNYVASDSSTGSPFLYQSTGTVSLGPDSVVSILPDYTSTDRVIGTELALGSQFNAQGEVVHMGADSLILAPGAALSISAGQWDYIADAFRPVSSFVYASGQIYLDADAMINVAGSADVPALVSDNIISLRLQGAELADSSLQRLGSLRGQTILVDVGQTGIYNGNTWIGTPLADVTGYVGLIQRTVGQLTANGGNVTLKAGESVVMQTGSSVDVSGGWIDYQGGMVQTTKVISNGVVYDISQATPDRVYDGIYDGFTTTSSKWGVTQTFSTPIISGLQYQPGYVQGGNAGALSISAPSMALDGTLCGNTAAGPRQTAILPAPASLSLAFQAQQLTPQLVYPVYSPTPPKVIFDGGNSLLPADAFALDATGNPLPLRADRKAQVLLSPDLINLNGFGAVRIINTDEDIVVPSSVTLLGAPKGSFTLAGANVDIEGRVEFPGGAVSLSAYNISPFEAFQLGLSPSSQTPPPNANRGVVTVGAGGAISTAGLVVDGAGGSVAASSKPLVVDGGSILINGYSASLLPGSSLDVSGGVVAATAGKFTYGKGGGISISTGQDLSIKSLLGGSLELGATLSGYSGSTGGSLSLLAQLVQIGGVSASQGTLWLTPDFFSQGGFNSFTINGIGAPTGTADQFVPAVVIAAGTTIAPVVKNVGVNSVGGKLVLTPFIQPAGLRKPVNLAFGGAGVINDFSGLLDVRSDFVMEAGTSIRTDAGASGGVKVAAQTATVLGSITTPGGTITINGGNSFASINTNPSSALPTVFLGSNSLLSAAGSLVLTPNAFGYRTGSVLNGGTITISGNVAARSGAVIDVSGATGVLDLYPGYSNAMFIPIASPSAPQVVPARVDSNAGSITLKGSQELFTDATLLGFAGGPSAVGGSLSVSSGIFYPLGLSKTSADINLVVTQSGLTLSNPTSPQGVGQLVFDAVGGVLPQLGYFTADRVMAGGFDSLALGGNVRFSGPVTITTAQSAKVATGGILAADASVAINAPYVAIGQPFLGPLNPQQQPFYFTQTNGQGVTTLYNFLPTFGPGGLTVTSKLIDLGVLSLQGVGRANFIANEGDIRGDGTLDVAGDIVLQAGQIYPPSAVSFTIAAYDHGGTAGSVTIEAAGSRQIPLSAGGQLNIFGSQINDNGVLRAPLGSINIGWDGTGTVPKGLISAQSVAVTQQATLGSTAIVSVSAFDPQSNMGLVIPYGLSPDGNTWVDPTGVDITVLGVPEKAITIDAIRVTTGTNSSIDLTGGGDMYAYRWLSGLGGTKDILASSGSFAVIPSYSTEFAPYAPFNASVYATALGSDPGYVNSNLAVGDAVYLAGSDSLPAGTYTLLPARYALLPGAFLVTPQTGTPSGATLQPDGSSIVSGYRFNTLNTTRTAAPLFAAFEVAPASVVRSRAEYADFLANSFLRDHVVTTSGNAPRFPIDSGRLVLQATQAMSLHGTVSALAPAGGRGGLVDISSPVDILIAAPGAASMPGILVLDSTELGNFDAESLLVGGTRSTTADGTSIAVATSRLTVDNAGAPLMGTDIILVANDNLNIAPGSQIIATASQEGSAEKLLLSGNGTLLRVGGDPAASIARSNVTAAGLPSMVIGAGAQLAGASLILDSSYATSLDPTASLAGQAITLDSGRISLQLNNPGILLPTTGLVLAGNAILSLQSAKALSLLSYTSIDIYGSGVVGSSLLSSLTLSSADIRGFNNNGNTVNFTAQNLFLNNSANASASPIVVTPPAGTLAFNADTIELGANQLRVDQFANLELNAAGGLFVSGSGGLASQGDLMITAPLITGAAGAKQSITTDGSLVLQPPAGGATATVVGGLGASLALQGASIVAGSDIVLPSGQLSLRATTGNMSINGRLDVEGTAQSFFDLVKYTDGGEISLIADSGSVDVAAGGVVSVSASPGGGSAGSLKVSAPTSEFSIEGKLRGDAGTGGSSGSLSLDIGRLPAGKVASISPALFGFQLARSIRDRLDSVVTLDGSRVAHSFSLSADSGSIDVTGSVDASGATGGTIKLQAFGSVTIKPMSLLSVSAQDFDTAGKGGSVSLEAGSEINGAVNGSAFVDIQTGSTINLSVASSTAASAALENFSGTLHLRAPQTAGNTEVQINPINGSILGASNIVVEGYQLFNLKQGGAITSTGSILSAGGDVLTTGVNVQGSIKANGTLFAGNTAAITTRLLGTGNALEPLLVIEPGAEVINLAGDLSLASDWDLSTYRFSPNKASGVLTLKAAGNLIFNGSLSDGFDPTKAAATAPANQKLWLAPLMTQNPLLPVNAQSWSYRLSAGADFGAADYGRVASMDTLAANSGSLQLGKNGGQATANGGNNATTSTLIPLLYQVIRTGTGDIDIAAGRDVQLLNQFATIYSAGVQVSNPTTLFSPNDFVLPIVTRTVNQGVLGAVQQLYPAQYSLAGGNVSVFAQRDMAHLTQDFSGNLIADSERQMPNNWLNRRGYVDPLIGQFGASGTSGIGSITDPAASTTWWIDFSNFFEGVGALGGGNVTLTAGRDVNNIDGLVPTNARMPLGTPNAAGLVELGGGNLVVKAGNNINGGVYYVERGNGTLTAGNDITTNSTRSPSLGILSGFNTPQINNEFTWLPTTLFAGKSSFNVSARGDVLLGPVANPFLLPQGVNNKFYYKTYFSTYSSDSSVDVSSLGGTLTLRQGAFSPSGGATESVLQLWMQSELLLQAGSAPSASFYQPWLRLDETLVDPFSTVFNLLPTTLRATVFSGDANLVGTFTLFPSPSGTLSITAAGSVNGLQTSGLVSGLVAGQDSLVWAPSLINLSDANTASVPGISSPFAYQVFAGRGNTTITGTITLGTDILSRVNVLFNESGSTQGAFAALQTQQALHAPGPLHAGDSQPLQIYAENGDISGFTLFTGKFSRVIAGQDITDIGLYLQNASASDISVVSAGRDLIPYNANSPLRVAAQQPGNALATGSANPQSGDIQIGGQGTLEVLSGRNLDLGTGANNSDGTGVGITSIGNGRNPFLPFDGANLIVGAGIGPTTGLGGSALDFDTFIADFINAPVGARYLSEAGLSGADFNALSDEDKKRVALGIFYLVLRDAGRDHNDPQSPGFGNYDAGFAAIATLFPDTQSSGFPWMGGIKTQARDIRTKNGGDIGIFAPGGGLTLASSTFGSPLAPPGIITESGGNISIFADNNVDIGIGRIFTLRGGSEVIWSSNGNIAAGSSSRTVKSAPPTRVLIDPQSADVQTDLAGLATGGGIGVLTTVTGVVPGDVDLIAPSGTVDAGEAGIRSSGNLNIAAVQVLNAGNIQAGGASVGTPAVSTPNVGGLTAASTTAGASNAAGSEQASAQNKGQQGQQQDMPSIITVEVIGYGGGSSPDDDEKKRKQTQGGVGRASKPRHEQNPQLQTRVFLPDRHTIVTRL